MTERTMFTAERRMMAEIQDGAPATVAQSVGNPEDRLLSILEVVARLESKMDELTLSAGDRSGVAAAADDGVLADQVHQVKMEIASLRHPKAAEDRIVAAMRELDAIVAATEKATDEILAAAETIEKIGDQLSLGPDDQAGLIAQLQSEVTNIYEASNFQDITGQRIAKAVRTLTFIEDRVSSMIQVWGADAFEDLPMPEEVSTDEEAALLNGPQHENEGISQAEIDALFD